MKKLILLCATFSFIFLQYPLPVQGFYDPFGDACQGPQTAESPACQTNATESPLTGPNGVIVKATRLIAFAAGIVAVIIIIVAGFRFMLSGGNTDAVNGARNTIIYAVVGLVVIVLAQFIVTFIVSRL